MNFYGAMSSLIDYSDEIALTTFTRGCNLRCPICHNPALVLQDRETKFPAMSEDRLIEIAKDDWYTGICITGGEPTLHVELPDAVDRIRSKTGLKIKLDTNGTNTDALSLMVGGGLLDFVAMDVKCPLVNDTMRIVTGVSNDFLFDAIRASVAFLKEGTVDYCFRTVCFEKFLPPASIGMIAESISPCKDYLLLPFDPHDTLDPSLGVEKPASAGYMEACLREARKYVENARIV